MPSGIIARGEPVDPSTALKQWAPQADIDNLRRQYDTVKRIAATPRNVFKLTSLREFMTDRELKILWVYLYRLNEIMTDITGEPTEKFKLAKSPAFAVGLAEWYRCHGSYTTQWSRNRVEFADMIDIYIKTAASALKEFRGGKVTIPNLPSAARRIVSRVIDGPGHFEAKGIDTNIYRKFVIALKHLGSREALSADLIGQLEMEINTTQREKLDLPMTVPQLKKAVEVINELLKQNPIVLSEDKYNPVHQEIAELYRLSRNIINALGRYPYFGAFPVTIIFSESSGNKAARLRRVSSNLLAKERISLDSGEAVQSVLDTMRKEKFVIVSVRESGDHFVTFALSSRVLMCRI